MLVNRLNTDRIRDISTIMLGEGGDPKPQPSHILATTTPSERAVFGHRNGIYGFVTLELLEYLRTLIAGRTAIEIGSGRGLLAGSLGIPATDSHMQEWPQVKAYYDMLRQPTITYGQHVEDLDYQAAIRHHKPQVVIASWVTHKYDPSRHEAGGNEFGVDEAWVIANCEEYIFIGNDAVHGQKPIWALEHTKERHPFIFSRSMHADKEFLARWTRKG